MKGLLKCIRGTAKPHPQSPEHWPLVLLYHGFYPVVDPADPFLGWNVSYQRFARQIEMLSRSCRFIDESEFMELARGDFRAARGTCLVTIDDAYGSVNDPQVQQVFDAHGVRPLLFILAGFLERKIVPWYLQLSLLLRRVRRRIRFENRDWDLSDPLHRRILYQSIQRAFLNRSPELARSRLADLVRLAEVDVQRLDSDMEPLSWEAVASLHRKGWSIGSHGWSHHPLARLQPVTVEEELAQSKRLIEQRLGITVRSVSYPNGSVSQMVCDQARRLFENGFAVPSVNPQDRFQVRRIDLGADITNECLNYRSLLPSAQTLADAVGERQQPARCLRHLVRWALRHSWKPQGWLPARQLLLHRPLPRRLVLKTACPAYSPAPQNQPRVAVFAASWPWQRYAVSLMSRHLNVVGVVMRQEEDPLIICKGGLARERRPWFPIGHPQRVLLNYHFDDLWEAVQTRASTEMMLLNPGESVNQPAVEQALKRWAVDYIFVFGTELLDERIYNCARRCAINLHWGLSPYYRGSHTIWWPLFEGRPEFIGGTVHLLTGRIDGGDVLAQMQPVVDGTESPEELEMMVSRQGVRATIRIIQMMHSGQNIRAVPQDHGVGAFYAAADFTAEVAQTVRAKLNDGLLADFARQQVQLRATVRLLNSPDLPGAIANEKLEGESRA